MRTINNFTLSTSRSGVVTALHVEKGVLVHSAIDPLAEASAIAGSFRDSAVHRVIVVGAGMGYVVNALAGQGVEVVAFEPFAELRELRAAVRRDRATEVRIQALTNVRQILRELNDGARLFIAPYVLALRDMLPSSLAADLDALHVHETTRALYQPLISNNERLNASALARVSRLSFCGRRSMKPAAIVGAGPSLARCLDTLSGAKQRLHIVAASGACPSMAARNLAPDWTIALEARDSVLADLDALPAGAKVVAFSWTHPDVFRRHDLQVYIADDVCALQTSGGTSALTAADFASRITAGRLFLVGIELSESQGAYAAGALRAGESRSHTPKFATMRRAFAEWIRSLGDRDVYHVVGDQIQSLPGALRLLPEHLKDELRSAAVADRKAVAV